MKKTLALAFAAAIAITAFGASAGAKDPEPDVHICHLPSANDVFDLGGDVSVSFGTIKLVGADALDPYLDDGDGVFGDWNVEYLYPTEVQWIHDAFGLELKGGTDCLVIDIAE